MRTYFEPPRETPVINEVDVLVVGGGPAGIAAATAAARLGPRVMLVERYGYLGGLATGGLVLYMDGLFDKQGRRWIGGLPWEALERLRGLGGLAEDTPTHLHVDPELLKIVADEMCVEAGVILRLHSWAVDTLVEDGRVEGIIVESKSGRQAILAREVVDATGDGDVASRAGANCVTGTMRIGLPMLIAGVDRAAFRTFRQSNPAGYRDLCTQVNNLGGFALRPLTTPNSDLGVYWVNNRGLAQRSVSAPTDATVHEFFAGDLNAIDAEDLTYAEVALRKRLQESLSFHRRYVPGFENVRLLAFASQLGVRDSRHVQGLYTLTKADVMDGTLFDDAIGIAGVSFAAVGHYQIPYRCLVPTELSGLLVAGRCISVDHWIVHSTRLIPPCMMTGQAAGTAAALAVRAGVAVRDLDAQRLRQQLEADGAILSKSSPAS